jgi:hypothetical protein
MDNQFLRDIADIYTKSPDEAFHGYVIMLNNRIWVSDGGLIFHPSRETAIRRFYNEMSWKVRRRVYHISASSNNNYRQAWFRFKKENNFEVKYI